MDLNSLLIIAGMVGSIVVYIMTLAVAFGVGKQVLSSLQKDVQYLKEKLIEGPNSLMEMITRHDERIDSLEEVNK